MAQEDTESVESSHRIYQTKGKIITNANEFDAIEKLKTFFCKVSVSILKFDDINGKIKPENIKLEIKIIIMFRN